MSSMSSIANKLLIPTVVAFSADRPSENDRPLEQQNPLYGRITSHPKDTLHTDANPSFFHRNLNRIYYFGFLTIASFGLIWANKAFRAAAALAWEGRRIISLEIRAQQTVSAPSTKCCPPSLEREGFSTTHPSHTTLTGDEANSGGAESSLPSTMSGAPAPAPSSNVDPASPLATGSFGLRGENSRPPRPPFLGSGDDEATLASEHGTEGAGSETSSVASHSKGSTTGSPPPIGDGLPATPSIAMPFPPLARGDIPDGPIDQLMSHLANQGIELEIATVRPPNTDNRPASPAERRAEDLVQENPPQLLTPVAPLARYVGVNILPIIEEEGEDVDSDARSASEHDGSESKHSEEERGSPIGAFEPSREEHPAAVPVAAAFEQEGTEFAHTGTEPSPRREVEPTKEEHPAAMPVSDDSKEQAPTPTSLDAYTQMTPLRGGAATPAATEGEEKRLNVAQRAAILAAKATDKRPPQPSAFIQTRSLRYIGGGGMHPSARAAEAPAAATGSEIDTGALPSMEERRAKFGGTAYPSSQAVSNSASGLRRRHVGSAAPDKDAEEAMRNVARKADASGLTVVAPESSDVILAEGATTPIDPGMLAKLGGLGESIVYAAAGFGSAALDATRSVAGTTVAAAIGAKDAFVGTVVVAYNVLAEAAEKAKAAERAARKAAIQTLKQAHVAAHSIDPAVFAFTWNLFRCHSSISVLGSEKIRPGTESEIAYKFVDETIDEIVEKKVNGSIISSGKFMLNAVFTAAVSSFAGTKVESWEEECHRLLGHAILMDSEIGYYALARLKALSLPEDGAEINGYIKQIKQMVGFATEIVDQILTKGMISEVPEASILEVGKRYFDLLVMLKCAYIRNQKNKAEASVTRDRGLHLGLNHASLAEEASSVETLISKNIGFIHSGLQVVDVLRKRPLPRVSQTAEAGAAGGSSSYASGDSEEDPSYETLFLEFCDLGLAAFGAE